MYSENKASELEEGCVEGPPGNADQVFELLETFTGLGFVYM